MIALHFFEHYLTCALFDKSFYFKVMDHGKGRHLHQAMFVAAAEFQAISFNIAHRKSRHLHLAISATDAELQGILFTTAQPLVIPNLTIIKCPVLLPQ